MIFDEYKPDGIGFDMAGKSHGLLLRLEVFPSEMRYAVENGSANLLARLKEEGYHPYSNLDRDSVV